MRQTVSGQLIADHANSFISNREPARRTFPNGTVAPFRKVGAGLPPDLRCGMTLIAITDRSD